MTLPSEYYAENLYPLQDGVLSIISRSDTDFFLTGGTALSRAYYNHRYSDDLDFFLNKSQTYDEQVENVLAKLREGGFVWDVQESFTRAQNFTTLRAGRKDSGVLLKLDFVNDLVPHFGGVQKTDLFCRTDSVRNILSNKLSAVYRYASKDVADIWEIARREPVNWAEAIMEAKQKEAGLEIPYVCEIMKGMPQSEFEAVAWVAKPEWEAFCDGISRIVRDMLAWAGG
jgi:predicted nucleotidyltransferase component of viral defense system